MIIIGVWLINGKFHATPWGRSPNEGATEWPPSPYRLLRALVSSWKTAIHDKQKEDVERLLQRLASQAPSFHLPPASVGHTRHYMPPHNYMPPHRGNTNLIMDTFVLVSKSDPVRIIWPNLVLDHNEVRLLGDLLRGLHYFGRGESWCEARIEDSIATKAEPNCIPYEEGASLLGCETALVPVLIPTRDVNLDGLTETTSELRKRNRLYPKGSQMRQYLREKVQISAVAAQRPSAKIAIEAVRYAVIDKVKPHITESLPIADTMRKAAMGKFGEANNGATSTLLSGKDESGNVLKDDHMHASYLPTDEDGDGFIDHVTVVAKGIDASPREIDALMRVKNLWSLVAKRKRPTCVRGARSNWKVFQHSHTQDVKAVAHCHPPCPKPPHEGKKTWGRISRGRLCWRTDTKGACRPVRHRRGRDRVHKSTRAYARVQIKAIRIQEVPKERQARRRRIRAVSRVQASHQRPPVPRVCIALWDGPLCSRRIRQHPGGECLGRRRQIGRQAAETRYPAAG